jgi:hypothetical protein
MNGAPGKLSALACGARPPKNQIPYGNDKRKRAGDSMGGGGAEESMPQGRPEEA